MARGAECYQVFFGVLARVAAKLFVMDFQLCHCAARLTPPAITTQDLLLQIFVTRWVQTKAGRIRVHEAQDACSLRPPRNACRCSSGRNLKNLVIENSSVSGSPLSRLAPARKSALIISKQ